MIEYPVNAEKDKKEVFIDQIAIIFAFNLIEQSQTWLLIVYLLFIIHIASFIINVRLYVSTHVQQMYHDRENKIY